jgi:hypothetical protein
LCITPADRLWKNPVIDTKNTARVMGLPDAGMCVVDESGRTLLKSSIATTGIAMKLLG